MLSHAIPSHTVPYHGMAYVRYTTDTLVNSIQYNAVNAVQTTVRCSYEAPSEWQERNLSVQCHMFVVDVLSGLIS